jgi:hypothetical protein
MLFLLSELLGLVIQADEIPGFFINIDLVFFLDIKTVSFLDIKKFFWLLI